MYGGKVNMFIRCEFSEQFFIFISRVLEAADINFTIFFQIKNFLAICMIWAICAAKKFIFSSLRGKRFKI